MPLFCLRTFIRFVISLQIFKKRLDIFSPQIEKKRFKEYLAIILAVKCKLSPVRSIGDNDFLRVISWACWYYHPLLVLVNYLLCYVAIYIC